MRLELLHHPGCPHAERVRRLLEECLSATGCRAVIIDTVGGCPSPTVLVDGRDVATAETHQPG